MIANEVATHYDRLRNRRHEIMMTLEHVQKEQRTMDENRDGIDRAAYDSRVHLLDNLAEWYTNETARIDEALRASPAQDVEKNLRALLAAWFDRLDLVLREDFEVQKKLLERAQAKLAELETRIAELEARRK